MKVYSKRPKGKRMFKSVHKTRPLLIEPVEDDLWFDMVDNTWRYFNDMPLGDHCGSTMYYSFHRETKHCKNVWSLKAALRRIRKWNMPKGTQFYVGMPYVGYDFIVTV